jgi:sugar lactone lactonase YvrE
VKLELLESGYGLIEGPRVDAAGNLYFSDVTNGGVYRRDPEGRVETVVQRRRGVGGIALHRDGGLVISGRDVCHVRAGDSRILLDRLPGVGGFNDLFTDAAGRVLVGSLRSSPFELHGERQPGELYRIEAEGRAVELYGDVGVTNGIGFSPDATILYHCDSAANHVIAHDVDPDGGVSRRRIFARLRGGAPDGLAVDVDGGVWVASYLGGCVQRFTALGDSDLRIDVPARMVTSLCFGGSDRRDLYIVTADNREHPERGGTIFRTRSEVPGLPAPPATV